MPREEVHGVGLHVVRLGTSGPRVAMVHGLLLGNLATWYFGAAPALAVDHRVILHDLRGHGRSDRPRSGYDPDTLATDLISLLGEEPAAIVGHSYGGLVALAAARLRPDLVTRLVLVDTPVPPTAPDEIMAFLHRSPEEMVAALPPGLADAVAGGGRQARRLVEHLTALATGTSILSDLTALAPLPDAVLAALPPLALIYGDRSACLPSGRALAEAVPGSRLTILPGGHWLHLDAPEALAAAIREALDG